MGKEQGRFEAAGFGYLSIESSKGVAGAVSECVDGCQGQKMKEVDVLLLLGRCRYHSAVTSVSKERENRGKDDGQSAL
jgi:hypothetical protein